MVVVQIVVAVLAIAFISFTLGMQILVQKRARALQGQAVPPLPGALGARVAKSPRALVYFFSQGCAACRPFTPRLRALGEKNRAVFVVDVMQDLDVARALGVLATPSAVEIEAGKVVGFHVGRVPEDVIARFA
jgi:thioredoxin 1